MKSLFAIALLSVWLSIPSTADAAHRGKRGSCGAQASSHERGRVLAKIVHRERGRVMKRLRGECQ